MSRFEDAIRAELTERKRAAFRNMYRDGHELTEAERKDAIAMWKSVMFGGPGAVIAEGLERLRRTMPACACTSPQRCTVGRLSDYCEQCHLEIVERPRMSFAVDVETREIADTRGAPPRIVAAFDAPPITAAEAFKITNAWLEQCPGFVLDGPRRPFEPSRDGITNACGEIPLPGSGGLCDLSAVLEDVPCLECNKLAPFTCAAHPMSKGLSWTTQKLLPPGTYDVTVESTTTVDGRAGFALVDKDGDMVATATLPPPPRRYINASVDGVTVEKVEFRTGLRGRRADVQFDNGETFVIRLDGPFADMVVLPLLRAFALGSLFKATASKVHDTAPVMFAFLELALLGRKVDVRVTHKAARDKKRIYSQIKITPSIPFTPAD